jgi:hypothetical protein
LNVFIWELKAFLNEIAPNPIIFFNRPPTFDCYRKGLSLITQRSDRRRLGKCIAQNNYAPFTKNWREIVTIQKNDGVGGHLI